MNSFDAPLAGLQSNLRGIATSAHNVANFNTDGYRAVRYDSASGTVAPRNPSPPADDAGESARPSDVDLATEFVEMERYEQGVRANAAVVRAADRMAGTLINLVG